MTNRCNRPGLMGGLNLYQFAANADRWVDPWGWAGYSTTPMDPYYGGEHLPGNTNNWLQGRSTVTYLDDTGRQAYKLTTKNGLLYDAKGNLFDTAGGSSLHRGGGGRAIFVMDSTGNIYASNYHGKGKFHHSSFLAGGPVAAAGEISVVRGKLTEITDRSGHYKPAPKFLAQAKDSLSKKGVRCPR